MSPKIPSVVAIVTGSTSDNPRIDSVRQIVQSAGINVVRFVNSAHRTPYETEAFAVVLPSIHLSPEVQAIHGTTHLRATSVIAAAGMAAHLGGALAAHNPAYPFIALPVSSSAMGNMDSTLAMWNMPPGVPTLLAPTNKIAGEMAIKMHNLALPSDFNTIAIDPALLDAANLDQRLLDKLGVRVGDSPISLSQQGLQESGASLISKANQIDIIIPTFPRQVTTGDNVVGHLDKTGFYMGLQNVDPSGKSKGRIDLTNAIIAAAQIIARHNPEVVERLVAFRKEQHDKVVVANEAQMREEVRALRP